MEYIKYDQGVQAKVYGLHNINSNCWCNSLTQLLLSLPSMNKLLLDGESYMKNDEFVNEFIKLVKNIDGNSDTESLIFAMNRKLAKKKSLVKFHGQECVDEALVTMLDLFELPSIERLFGNSYEREIKCNNCDEVIKRRDNSVKINMFTNANILTQDDFCNYIYLHPSECNSFTCEHCKHTQENFLIIERLKMLREVIIIVFNKFYHKDNKWFPQRLSFISTDNKEINYKLVGKIEHSGTMSGGHYIAHCLRDDKVYMFNDTYIREGNLAPTENTFLICYHME